MERVRWLNDEQTLLYVDLALPSDRQMVTLAERLQPLRDATIVAQAVDHPLDVLVDLREARVLPRGNWLTAIRELNEIVPPNVRQVIVVGSRYVGLFNKILAAIGSFQELRINAVFVRTMEEAQALLDKQDNIPL
ncbi:hypothetical protein ACFLYO_08690 [Chloroflexota bacterium]